VKDLSKSYGDHVVFKDANIVIERGEKSLSWENGEGKSTIKAIMKEIEWWKFRNWAQRTNWLFCANQASLLDENATIFETTILLLVMCEQNQRYFRGFYVSRRRCYQEGKSTFWWRKPVWP
jgi:ATPase subunit of ABC transporter with duplicated ATPase domains